MAEIPQMIPEIGSVEGLLRPNPNYVPGQGMTTEDYFLLSRCDGATSVKDIILMSGFNPDKCVNIFVKLRKAGAILLENESEKQVETISKQKEVQNSKVELDNPSADEILALNEKIDLSEEEKLTILSFVRRLNGSNHYELLGVDPKSTKKEIRSVYFKYSKEFHPDKKYGSKLGSFEDRLNAIFSSLNRAYQELGTQKKRKRYDASIGLEGQAASQGQSKEEHAFQLYQQACNSELQGAFEEALKLFKASLNLQKVSKRSKRAALCAIRAHELEMASEFANEARELNRNDPAVLRVLADIEREKRNWEKAKELLNQALDIRTENDSLVTEIQSDIAWVEAQLKAGNRE